MTSSLCQYCGEPLERLYMELGGVVHSCGFKPCNCEGARLHREKIEKRNRELEEREQRKRRSEKIKRSGIPKRYQDAKGCFPEHIEAVRAGRSLIFTGGVGSGKTYAACSIAMELLDEMSVKFSSLSVINAAIFSDETTEEALFYSLSRCKLLILDDLGKDKPSDWLSALTYKVINARYESELPVIVTTNYTIVELRRRLCVGGDSTTADAIASRLYEMSGGKTVPFGGADRRLRAND